MSIQMMCGHCGERFRVPDEAAGRTGKCRKCGRGFVVPGSSSDDAGSRAVRRSVSGAEVGPEHRPLSDLYAPPASNRIGVASNPIAATSAIIGGGLGIAVGLSLVVLAVMWSDGPGLGAGPRALVALGALLGLGGAGLLARGLGFEFARSTDNSDAVAAEEAKQYSLIEDLKSRAVLLGCFLVNVVVLGVAWKVVAPEAPAIGWAVIIVASLLLAMVELRLIERGLGRSITGIDWTARAVRIGTMGFVVALGLSLLMYMKDQRGSEQQALFEVERERERERLQTITQTEEFQRGNDAIQRLEQLREQRRDAAGQGQ